jgi:probable F420-dependent oxidoreductase
MGFDSLWLGDHIVIPDEIRDMNSYPYLWRFRGNMAELFPDKNFIETIAACGFIAGATTRLQIGTGVLVVPMRGPVELAKQLASIDVLSGGRLIAGVGAGWLREEFDALGRPFDHRGARLDEALALMRELWSGKPTSFEGRYYTVERIHCLPTPIQQGGPPIWIGGHTDAALRRCARLASGWHAVELPPEQFTSRSRDLDALALAAGRRPDEITRSVACRLRLGGSVEEAQEIVRSYQAAGCEHLVVYATVSRSIQENLKRYERFMTEVAPGLSAGQSCRH